MAFVSAVWPSASGILVSTPSSSFASCQGTKCIHEKRRSTSSRNRSRSRSRSRSTITTAIRLSASSSSQHVTSSSSPDIKKKGFDLQYRRLGDSDLIVPEICLGTMTFGRQNTLEEGFSQMDYALGMGVNFLDTAEMYPVPATDGTLVGETEVILGEWIKSRKVRKDIILATKVCGAGRSMKYIRNGPRVNRANIMKAIDGSLIRLKTDHIDLYQIHWPDRYVPMFGGREYDIRQERDSEPIVEQLKVMKELVDLGKIRYVGLSNETTFGLCEFVKYAEKYNLPKVVSVQNSYSLLHREFESSLAEACSPKNLNVGLLAYSPLAGGALSGKYDRNRSPPENSRFTLFPGYMKRFQESLSLAAVEEYVKIAQKHNISPATLALAFVRSKWFNTSTIIGATNVNQLKENIHAFTVTLSDETVNDVNALYKRFRDPPLS